MCCMHVFEGTRKHISRLGQAFVRFKLRVLTQDELATLQQRDPEFFAYLQQTDSDLLTFSLPQISKDKDEQAADDSDGEDDEVKAVIVM